MDFKRLLTLAGLALFLSACGQKGPLLLKQPVKPVTSKPPIEDKAEDSATTIPTKPTFRE